MHGCLRVQQDQKPQCQERQVSIIHGNAASHTPEHNFRVICTGLARGYIQRHTDAGGQTMPAVATAAATAHRKMSHIDHLGECDPLSVHWRTSGLGFEVNSAGWARQCLVIGGRGVVTLASTPWSTPQTEPKRKNSYLFRSVCTLCAHGGLSLGYHPGCRRGEVCRWFCNLTPWWILGD